jgi:hypothetical protein
MKLVPYDINKAKRRPKTDNFAVLEEFANSGLECVMIEDYTQKNANICATSLRTSIKRYRRAGVSAFVRDGKVFLVKTTENKKK